MIQHWKYADIRDGYPVDSVDAVGGVRGSRFQPSGTSLWSAMATVAAGTRLAWTGPHGDEALWVSAGAIEVDGQRCGPETAVVIEAEAQPCVDVIDEATIWHVGSADHDLTKSPVGAPGAGRADVHITGSSRRAAVSDEEPVLEFFADSFCATCRISFFVVSGPGAYRSPSHVHSEDEILHVMDGDLRLGRDVVAAGASVFIPGGVRYGFQTSGPFGFLNYRRDASLCTIRPGSAPFLEAGRDGRLLDIAATP